MGGEVEPGTLRFVDETSLVSAPSFALFRCNIGSHPINDGEEVFVARRRVGSVIVSEVLCAHHRHLVVSLSKLSWRRL